MNAIEQIKADYTLRLLEVHKGKFENKTETFGPHGSYQRTREASKDWWEPHLAARALSYIHTGEDPPDTVSSFFGEGDGAELYLRIIKELLLEKTAPVFRPMTDDELICRYIIRNGPCEWPTTDEELKAVSAWEASIPDGSRSPTDFCRWSNKKDGRLHIESLGPLVDVWDGERLHGSMLRTLADRLLELDLAGLQPAPAAVKDIEPVASKKRYKRTGWFDVAGEYVVGLYKANGPMSAKELYRLLQEHASDADSPFKVKNQGLLLKQSGNTVTFKTLENKFKTIKLYAQK